MESGEWRVEMESEREGNNWGLRNLNCEIEDGDQEDICRRRRRGQEQRGERVEVNYIIKCAIKRS